MSPIFTITSVTIPREPPRLDGQTVHATMTVEAGPFLLVGVQLVHTADGEWRCWMPRMSQGRRVAIRGVSERAELVQRALEAFRAATGRDPAETPVAKASPKMDTLHDPA